MTCVHHHGDRLRGDTLPRACLPITHSRPWGSKVSLLRAVVEWGRLGLMIHPRNKADQGQEPWLSRALVRGVATMCQLEVQLRPGRRAFFVTVLG